MYHVVTLVYRSHYYKMWVDDMGRIVHTFIAPDGGLVNLRRWIEQ